MAALVAAGWFAYWSGLNEELESAQAQEQTLKDEYTQKVAKAVNLDDLRRQKVLAEQYVGVLEKQLPSRAEMDALLSDINQAGVGRGATLQLFRPGSVELKKHYAELPIAVKVVGGFHDLASFSSDLAQTPSAIWTRMKSPVRRPGARNERAQTMDDRRLGPAAGHRAQRLQRQPR